MHTSLFRLPLVLLGAVVTAPAVLADQEVKYDHYLRSKWNTVSMGVYTTEYEPIPHMETPTHYVFIGIHDSLDEAVRQATKNCVDFLQKKEGLDFYDAYALTSMTTDFTVTRALLPAQMIHALVPKHIFKRKSEYWYTGPMPPKY